MIITSALDQDLYKLTMQQAVLHQFPRAIVEYQFKCRTGSVDFRVYEPWIVKSIKDLCERIKFTDYDIEYLRDTLPFLKNDYLEFLKDFRFQSQYIIVYTNSEKELVVKVEGPWLQTILFEMPILQIISELYSRSMSVDYVEANSRTLVKADFLANKAKKKLLFSEFGGRRRHSVEAQRNALGIFKKVCPNSLVGTSNLMFAREFGIKAVGTMAHEWLQAHQAIYDIPGGLEQSQYFALHNWLKEYPTDLGIALSDVIGLKYFLYDFDEQLSNLYIGTRQDSGDPLDYGEALIKHYEKCGIDPNTKTIIFSDSLTFKTAYEILEHFDGRIGVSFGIGTNITNDFDFKPIQIVLKMTKCNGKPVAKLSDSLGKTMDIDKSYTNYLKQCFDKHINAD
jgi:nicotinate phosphoribosyltransferase